MRHIKANEIIDHGTFKRQVDNLNLIRNKLKKNIACKDPHCQSAFNKDLLMYLDNIEEQIIQLEHRVKKLEKYHEEGVVYD